MKLKWDAGKIVSLSAMAVGLGAAAASSVPSA
jgi:hypothetical protein